MKELEDFEMLAAQPEPPSFKAIITRVIRAGLMMELDGLMIRGLVSSSDPGLDGAFYDHARECFSTRSGRVWRSGDMIDVQPAGIERERSSVLFRLAAAAGHSRSRGPARGPSRDRDRGPERGPARGREAPVRERERAPYGRKRSGRGD